jgi:hypothetical protein
MRERINADDAISLEPRISPLDEPIADTGRKTSARCASGGVLYSGMLLLPNEEVCKTKEVFEFELIEC